MSLVEFLIIAFPALGVGVVAWGAWAIWRHVPGDRPHPIYRCTVCLIEDHMHRFDACPGGRWEEVPE